MWDAYASWRASFSVLCQRFWSTTECKSAPRGTKEVSDSFMWCIVSGNFPSTFKCCMICICVCVHLFIHGNADTAAGRHANTPFAPVMHIYRYIIKTHLILLFSKSLMFYAFVTLYSLFFSSFTTRGWRLLSSPWMPFPSILHNCSRLLLMQSFRGDIWQEGATFIFHF